MHVIANGVHHMRHEECSMHGALDADHKNVVKSVSVELWVASGGRNQCAAIKYSLYCLTGSMQPSNLAWQRA